MRRFACIIASAMLAACSGGTVVVSDFRYAGSYDPGMVQDAARAGVLPLEVNGSRFDAAAIAAALPAPGWLGNVRFAPATPGTGGYRVVLSFPSGGGEPCGAERPRPPAAAGPVRVEAAFCAGTRVISSISAQGAPAGTADDPAFRELMSEVMLALLPATSPGRGGGSGGGGGGAGM